MPEELAEIVAFARLTSDCLPLFKCNAFPTPLHHEEHSQVLNILQKVEVLTLRAACQSL